MQTRGVPEVNQRYYAQWQKDFVLKDNLLFLNLMPSNSTETISVFVVPAQKCQAAIDGCHQSAGHQGHDRTLSLMKERFWWPGMSWALVMAMSNCRCCKQFEAKLQIPPRELAQMKKQCFFASLQENYKYLVSHLKDQDDVDPVLMLKEIWECDEL